MGNFIWRATFLGLFTLLLSFDLSAAEGDGENGAIKPKALPEICFTKPEKEISATYLTRVAVCLYGGEAAVPDVRRVALVQDIANKAWTYAWLNKVTFWIAIALALGVLVWPSFVAINAAPTPTKQTPKEECCQRRNGPRGGTTVKTCPLDPTTSGNFGRADKHCGARGTLVCFLFPLQGQSGNSRNFGARDHLYQRP